MIGKEIVYGSVMSLGIFGVVVIIVGDGVMVMDGVNVADGVKVGVIVGVSVIVTVGLIKRVGVGEGMASLVGEEVGNAVGELLSGVAEGEPSDPRAVPGNEISKKNSTATLIPISTFTDKRLFIGLANFLTEPQFWQ